MLFPNLQLRLHHHPYFFSHVDMEEKSKGFSLRQKKSSRRPPISAPQQISSTAAPAPIPLENGNVERYPGANQGGRNEKPEPARQRPRPGGHTSDLVKRRYSTRFTTLGDFRNADAPPIPILPTAGSNQSTQQKPQTSSTAVHKIDVDLTALRDTNLRADDCKLVVPFLPNLKINW